MLPEIWGKYGWNFIHLVTLDYPKYPTEEDKQNYYNFFYTLQFVLPCDKCRYNLSHHLKKYPLNDNALSSRNNLVKWGIDLHNIVNYYTGKPMLTYSEALDDINSLTYPEKTNNIIYVFLVVVALIIICYLLYHYACRQKIE
jgi:hypothetical protein